LEPIGRWADPHVFDQRGTVTRAEVRRLDRDARTAGDRRAYFGVGEIGLAHAGVLDRGNLAGDAEDRLAVRSIGGQLEVEDAIAEIFAKWGTDWRVLGQDEDALVLIGEAELLLGADHSLRLDTSDLLGLERDPLLLGAVAVEQAGAEAGEGH